jgi:hypothetical protein
MPAEPDQSPFRRRPLVLGVVAGVLAAAVSIPVLARADWGPGRGTDPPEGNVVVPIDPVTNTRESSIDVDADPGDVVWAAGSVWVASLKDETVQRIDPMTRRPEQRIEVRKHPAALAASGDTVWIVSRDRRATTTFVDGANARYESSTAGRGSTARSTAVGSRASRQARDDSGSNPEVPGRSRASHRGPSGEARPSLPEPAVRRRWRTGQVRSGSSTRTAATSHA